MALLALQRIRATASSLTWARSKRDFDLAHTGAPETSGYVRVISPPPGNIEREF